MFYLKLFLILFIYFIETDLLKGEEKFYRNVECIERLTELYQFLYDMYQLPPNYTAVVSDAEYLNDVCKQIYPLLTSKV